MARMTLWHRTDRAAAQDIIENGFRDGEGKYLTKNPYRGVWVSDEPLNVSDGACGDTLLRIDFKGDEAEIAEHEWREEGKGFREWLIPAKLLNERAQVSVDDIEDDEEKIWSNDS